MKRYSAERIVDVYASTEDLVTAYTLLPSDEKGIYKITSKTLLELVDENFERVSEKEYGKIMITSLFPVNSYPGIIFINYLIGDEAKKIDENHIEGIRRYDDTVSIAGAKENPTTIERIIFNLIEKYKGLTGEYLMIWKELEDGRQGIEIRIESKEKYDIEDEIKKQIFGVNYPLWNEVKVGNAFVEVKIVEPSKLYPEGYEPKPGKPKRLLIKGRDF